MPPTLLQSWRTFACVGCVVAALATSAGCAPKTPATTAPPPSTGAATPPAALQPAPVQPPAAPSAAAAAAQAPGETPPRPRPPAPPPLLGHVTREQVRNYESWKALFATAYVPDAAAVATIRANARGITVLLVIATWCPDSKREVPRFFAIMDAAGIAESAITMVGVDRTKKDAEGLTERWGVTRVPTFIFLRSGQEVGRVVERTPQGSTLEAEMAKLISTVPAPAMSFDAVELGRDNRTYRR